MVGLSTVRAFDDCPQFDVFVAGTGRPFKSGEETFEVDAIYKEDNFNKNKRAKGLIRFYITLAKSQ